MESASAIEEFKVEGTCCLAVDFAGGGLRCHGAAPLSMAILGQRVM